jgi:hypothetical protein
MFWLYALNAFWVFYAGVSFQMSNSAAGQVVWLILGALNAIALLFNLGQKQKRLDLELSKNDAF